MRAVVAAAAVLFASATGQASDFGYGGGDGFAEALLVGGAVVVANVGFTAYDAVGGRQPNTDVAAAEMVIGGLETVSLVAVGSHEKEWPFLVLATWPATLTLHGAWANTAHNGRVPLGLGLAPIGGLAVDVLMVKLWPDSSGSVAVVPVATHDQVGLVLTGRF